MRKKNLLLTIAALAITTMALAAPITAQAKVPSKLGYTTEEEWKALKLTNKIRARYHRYPLTTYSKIQKAAGIRALELKAHYSHTRPDGRGYSTVGGDVGCHIGTENIAGYCGTAEEAIGAWEKSPNHLGNMIGTCTHVGIGDSPISWDWAMDFDHCTGLRNVYILDGSKALKVSKGTSIDDMDRVLAGRCECGVTSYAPVIKEMCSGYNSQKPGIQTIKVTYNFGNRYEGCKDPERHKETTYFLVEVVDDTATSKKSIRGAKISGIKNKVYSGKGLKQDITVRVSGKTLKPGRDYYVSYYDNIDAGKATLYVSGKGNYTGTVKKTFTIKKRSLKDCKISYKKSIKYTGKKIVPTVKVSISKSNFRVSKKNYTIKFSNNKSVGTAKMVITAKKGSNFKGSVTKTFKIKPLATLNSKNVWYRFCCYADMVDEPSMFIGMKGCSSLLSGRDYKESRSISADGTIYTVTLKGVPKYGYSGTVTFKFDITDTDNPRLINKVKCLPKK